MSKEYFDINTSAGKCAAAVVKAIKSDKFNYENYTGRRMYRGICEIQTQPLFVSYGQIGYSVSVYDERGSHAHEIEYDWEKKELTVDDMSEEELAGVSRKEEFISKLAALLGQYGAEITCTEVTINGGEKIEQLCTDDPKDPFVLAEDTVLWW